MPRFLAALLLLGACLCAFPQAPTPSGQTLFETVRPDLIITIRKHQFGTDLVEVSCRAEGYPADLLRAQVADYGKRMKDEPRGMRTELDQIQSAAGTLTYLKATFGIMGLIDREHGRINLQPLVQAFTGEHGAFTVKGLEILLDGEHATEGNVRRFRSASIDLDGIRVDNPPSLEYRIAVKTTEPDKVFIPSWSGEQPEATPASSPPPKSDTTMYVLIAIGALAIGALVYSFLLRQPARRSK